MLLLSPHLVDVPIRNDNEHGTEERFSTSTIVDDLDAKDAISILKGTLQPARLWPLQQNKKQS